MVVDVRVVLPRAPQGARGAVSRVDLDPVVPGKPCSVLLQLVKAAGGTPQLVSQSRAPDSGVATRGRNDEQTLESRVCGDASGADGLEVGGGCPHGTPFRHDPARLHLGVLQSSPIVLVGVYSRG